MTLCCCTTIAANPQRTAARCPIPPDPSNDPPPPPVTPAGRCSSGRAAAEPGAQVPRYGGGVLQEATPDAPTHRTGTTERGSFCFAHCSCGWRGPARRSRERARADADAHATTT
ncbi:hypothetical protein GCM10010346_49450 [Streptomyces chryseus]|uniref:Uncharacterized protein n=1 Tax=Streptomyces chryseus TaxID=68186 RepID=A0ABQ3DYG3_9ACTN|nr:hypothetical protein GCM10010346_49450 [Streptomyces chryseus]